MEKFRLFHKILNLRQRNQPIEERKKRNLILKLREKCYIFLLKIPKNNYST